MYLQEIARELELYLDEEDVVRRVGVAPLPDLRQAHRQAVARRHRIQNGQVEYEPPGKRFQQGKQASRRKIIRLHVKRGRGEARSMGWWSERWAGGWSNHHRGAIIACRFSNRSGCPAPGAVSRRRAAPSAMGSGSPSSRS